MFPVSTDIMVLIVGDVSMNSAVLHNESSGAPRQTQGAGPSKQLLYPGEGQEHSDPEFRGSLFRTPRVHSKEVKSEHDLALQNLHSRQTGCLRSVLVWAAVGESAVHSC